MCVIGPYLNVANIAHYCQFVYEDTYLWYYIVRIPTLNDGATLSKRAYSAPYNIRYSPSPYQLIWYCIVGIPTLDAGPTPPKSIGVPERERGKLGAREYGTQNIKMEQKKTDIPV